MVLSTLGTLLCFIAISMIVLIILLFTKEENLKLTGEIFLTIGISLLVGAVFKSEITTKTFWSLILVGGFLTMVGAILKNGGEEHYLKKLSKIKT